MDEIIFTILDRVYLLQRLRWERFLSILVCNGVKHSTEADRSGGDWSTKVSQRKKFIWERGVQTDLVKTKPNSRTKH